MQKKFSYPVKIDELSQKEYKFSLDADASEREDIKAVLQVEGVDRFCADIFLKLNLREHLLRVWGTAEADLVLQSVISLNNFQKHYQADFELIFDTKATYRDIKEMDNGINSDIPDVVLNGTINLADIALEQIALQMEDYPRAEGEVFDFSPYASAKDDERDANQENPFAVLAKLKK